MTDLLVIFAISIGVVFHKFRLPSVVGFLTAGILMVPHGLNTAADSPSLDCHRSMP
jgi:CPA2 family monovalent cation:H+ antiporter-2